MEAILRFQTLLKELFQFEASDLDFGIYRIMNYKRNQIENFIEKELITKIESAFSKHKDEKVANINQKFEEIKGKIIQILGSDAITPSGELKEQFKDTPLGREYLSIKAQREEIQAIDEIKLQVFNDLYSFFSRYYEEGDFIPHYRYSIKGHKYAIPYNGEEVKLYWANSEQYYIKTGLLFRDYTFRLDSYKVVFRTVEAKEEIGSNKATKQRFFVLDDASPLEFDAENETLFVRFQYRELFENELRQIKSLRGEPEETETSEEEKKIKVKQEEINYIIEREILTGKLLKKKDDEIMHLRKMLYSERDEGRTILLYHLNRFTAKNTKDYFIHKNLRKFLSEQLDYFIKSEVLSVETLEKERFLDKHITRAKVVREIGEAIIEFLAQIEDFQKRLWEKKKFVLRTDYVITTDRIFSLCHLTLPRHYEQSEESLSYFYTEILNNKKQIKEWEEFGFEIEDLRLEDLKSKKLPVDTRYFSQEFKERLLEKLTENADLDDLLDGLLIKSENWQALNLLLGKYNEKVKCIYIDPPYNSKTTEILYRNFYKHSSWLSLIENRLSLSRKMSTADGSHIIAIDENEQERLGCLLSMIFPNHQKICVAVIHNKKGIQGDYFSYNHDYAFFCISPGLKKTNQKPIPQSEWEYENLRKWGKESERETAKNCFYPIIVKNNSIIGFGDVCSESFHPGASNIKRKDGSIEVYPVDSSGVERKWRYARNSVEDIKHLLKVYITNKGEVQILKARDSIQYKTVWDDPIYIAGDYGTRLLTEMGIFPEEEMYPKSIYTVRDSIHAVSDGNSIVLDYFAGSGTTAHAVMKLNKEDGGKRKFILVEMANYFDTVIIPRIKKISYSFNWKNGKPQDTDGIGVFFKYQILEQYEDTLDNIELTENKQAESLFKDEYLLKYFFDFETRESPYLLNIENLKNPFTYKLKVNLQEVGEPEEMIIDIPETFNYLLGLKVRKIKIREMDRKYLFILGEKDGKDYVVVWREYSDSWTDEDFKKDKEFINKELEGWNPQVVYINGQSILTPKSYEIRYIEPEFKSLMEN